MRVNFRFAKFETSSVSLRPRGCVRIGGANRCPFAEKTLPKRDVHGQSIECDSEREEKTRPEPWTSVHRGRELLPRQIDRWRVVLNTSSKSDNPAIADRRLVSDIEGATVVPVGNRIPVLRDCFVPPNQKRRAEVKTSRAIFS